jgi:hypothetical protein
VRIILGELAQLMGEPPGRVLVVVAVRDDLAARHLAGTIALGADGLALVGADIADLPGSDRRRDLCRCRQRSAPSPHDPAPETAGSPRG